MAHLHPVEDDRGDLIDVIVFCSDYCHRQYDRENDLSYGGWYGCMEIPVSEPCAYCEQTVWGVDGAHGLFVGIA